MFKRPGLLFVLILAVFTLSLPVMAQDAPGEDPIVTDNEVDALAEDAVETTEEVAESTLATADNFLDRLTTQPQSDVARVLLILGGIALLIAGWAIYDAIVLVAGVLIGALVGVSVVVTQSVLLEIGALVIGALIGGVLAVFVYYAAIFFVGGYAGLLLTYALANTFSLEPVTPLAALVGVIIGGIILLALASEFLILLSALVGAQLVTLGLGLDATWMVLLAILGVIVQLLAARQFNVDVRRRPRRSYLPGRT